MARNCLLIHEGKAEPLLSDFAASADASVSFDGASVLFSGKKNAGDPWQIWEMTLADRKVRQVVTSGSDAMRPLVSARLASRLRAADTAWLPDAVGAPDGVESAGAD